jgi:hypothetical protein
VSEYAKHTSVPPEKSKAEIEKTLSRYGATSFASGWTGTSSTIVFEAKGRRVRFVLPLPSKKDFYSDEKYNQAIRQKWRCMALAIKAKLEVVESGIATFEEEFMSHIVLPNGATVGQWMGPQIEQTYKSGSMPPLLIGSGE